MADEVNIKMKEERMSAPTTLSQSTKSGGSEAVHDVEPSGMVTVQMDGGATHVIDIDGVTTVGDVLAKALIDAPPGRRVIAGGDLVTHDFVVKPGMAIDISGGPENG